ncbi:serine hydrolase [Limosilactobacillus pontis]|nr:serine hydrolase [Limosilactobacillus pontis]
MEVYADNNPRLNSVVRPFATAKGIDFVNDRMPLFSISNMDDLRAMVFYGVTMMLFKDKDDYYSHAQNFLTAHQPIMSMAVYPSVIDGLETANVSDGSHFTYHVHVVDMHYIWASGLNSVIGFFGRPDSFVNYSNHVYYYGHDGRLYQNRFYTNWGHSYYFSDDGVRATSEVVKVGNDYYYFDNQGIMKTNYFLNQGGKVYYFGNDGKEYRDRFYNNWGHTYYFGADGARYTNQFYNNWGHTYYFGNDGARWDNRFYNNWGHTYYFGNDGARWDNCWMNAWGHWYYFKGDGVRATSEIAKVGNDYYYFDNRGIMKTNFFLNQDRKVYYFGNDGKEYRDRFYTNWEHTYYFGADGARYTNQFYNNWGHTYYFGADGARWDNRWMNAWGHRYYFKWDGSRATAEYFPVNGETYYFDNQGIAHDDPLVTQWKNLLNGYHGHNAMIAIQSQKDGIVREYNNNPGHRYTMASTVKVAVLAQLLHNTNGNLNGYQQSLAARMIRNSDNAATTEIVRNYLGGVSRMQDLYNALGMSETTPGPGTSWGLTTTTATDQLKLLNEIYMKPHSNYLNDQSRNYIKSLMGSVSGDQRWGISAGSSQYYIKNGWLALSAPWPWYVDSIGFIPQDNNNGYTIAVYTDNNIPMQVGVNMIESLARATKNIFNTL